MSHIQSNDRYHALSIAAHWLTLALLVAVYALIDLRDVYPKGTSAHDAMKTWHFMLGLTVLLVVAVRLVLRSTFPEPPITPPLPAWQMRLAKAMYVALYTFLMVMPILGWFTLSAKGKVIPFFGVELPSLVGVDKTLGHRLEEIHETVGTIGYYLIGLHVATALFHHHFRHDNTLRRMLPWRQSRKPVPPTAP